MKKNITFILFDWSADSKNNRRIDVEILKKEGKCHKYLGEIKYKPQEPNGSFVEDSSFKKVKNDLDPELLNALSYALEMEDYKNFPNMSVFDTNKQKNR